MAYDEELRLLHKTTQLGKQHYHEMLEEKADEILFRHEHPFKWLMSCIMSIFEQ